MIFAAQLGQMRSRAEAAEKDKSSGYNFTPKKAAPDAPKPN